MISSRQTAIASLFALAMLPFSAATFAADDGPVVNDYSDMGADYNAPKESKSEESSSKKSASQESTSGGGADQSNKSASADSGSKEDGKPYNVDCSGDGPCKVGQSVLTGYDKFGQHCARCHGENAQGSTFAPSLAQAFQAENKGQGNFTAAVAGGLTVKDTTTGGYRVMPAWAENEDVMSHMQQLWSFVKARSDGALKPGRPQAMENNG